MNSVDPQEILNALPSEYYVIDLKQRTIIQTNNSTVKPGQHCFKALFNSTNPCNQNPKACFCQAGFLKNDKIEFELEREVGKEKRFFRVNGSLVREGIAVLSTTNITDHVNLKREVKNHAKRNRRAENLANFGFWDFLAETQEFVISEGARHIYGIDAEKVSYEGIREYTHPDDLDAFDKAVKELLEFKKPADLMFRIFQAPNQNLRYVKALAEFIDNKCYGILLDITEFVSARKAQVENERYLKHLFASMNAGFAQHKIVLNEKGEPEDYIFLDVNSNFEKLTGLKKANLINKTVKEVLPHIEKDWINRFGQVALTGIPDEFENYSAELDRYYHVSAFSPQKNYFAVTFYDVTTRKNAENALRKAKENAVESDRLKTQFLANLSHEIRTPLTGILGFSNLICTEDLSKDQLEYYGKIIQNSGERLLMVIDDIVCISLIQSSQLQVQCEKFDCMDMLEELYELFESKRKEALKDIRIVLRKSKSENAVLCSDKLHVFEIMRCLIDNALKYTDEGSIEFGVDSSLDGDVEFFVKDTGIGIAKDKLKVIFVPFRQVEEGEARNYEGFGLGLAIVDGLVNSLGGTVYVDSTIGEGSTFKVVLPQCSQSEQTAYNTHVEAKHTFRPDLQS